LSGQELTKRTSEMKREAGKRIVRLARIHSGAEPDEQAALRAFEALAKMDSKAPLEPGEDLEKAVQAIVGEHVEGEAAPFAEPDSENSADPACSEWANRGALAVRALNSIILEPFAVEDVERALSEALPLTSKRDSEGLALTSSAVAEALRKARSYVRAERAVADVLKAAGVEKPGDELKSRAALTIAGLDALLFGFPDEGDGSERITASVTGQHAVDSAFGKSAIAGQTKWLAAALAVLAVVLAVAFRSVSRAAMTLATSSCMLALMIGIMGILSIPLDISTGMIAATAL